MDFVVGDGATWLSFFLFFKSGEKHAIVGNLDIEKFRRTGLFDTVLRLQGQSQGRPAGASCSATTRTRSPSTIPPDCAAADGLTHGNYLNLLELLKGTDFAGRLVSAEAVIAKLRGRKSAEELRRLKQACQKTLEIYGRVGKAVKPGMSEKELAGWITVQREKMGLAAAWEVSSCPAVFSGPQEIGAHSAPTGNVLQARPHLQHRFRRQGRKILLRPAADLVHPAPGRKGRRRAKCKRGFAVAARIDPPGFRRP